jgi:hypothetical protein
MENRSRHYGDIIKWIEKVIESCETREQLFAAKTLIFNFEKQLQRQSIERYWRDDHYNIIRPLESIVSDKMDELYKKQFEL